MDSYDAWGGGCMAPVSSLGTVVSWEEDDSDGGARAVLLYSGLPAHGGWVKEWGDLFV